MNTIKEVLVSVEHLLETKGWCQNRLRNNSGAHCLIGAVVDTVRSGKFRTPSENALFYGTIAKLREALPYGASLASFNDTKGRKLEDVLGVVRKARINA